MAVGGEHGIGKGLDGTGVGDVELVVRGPASTRFDLTRDGLRGLCVQVRDVHLRSVGREQQGGRAPDTRAAARDDRDPACQVGRRDTARRHSAIQNANMCHVIFLWGRRVKCPTGREDTAQ